MATPAHKLAVYRRWYSVYAERRGGRPPPALSDAELAEAIARGSSMLHVALGDGERGRVVGGIRTLARPVTAVFFLGASLDTETALALLRAAEHAHKGSDIDLIGDPLMLNQTVPKKLAEHGARHRVEVRYLPNLRFVTDIARHVHLGAAVHYLPDRDELERYLRFTFTAPPGGREACPLSRLSVHDPQCVWLGARAGDVVAVRECTAHAETINYYQVIAARLGLKGLKQL